MTSTSHLLIGAALGAATRNPVGAFFVGVASHFIADAIPHSDIGTFRAKERKGKLAYTKTEYWEAYLDIIIGSAVVLGFALKSPGSAENILFGAAGAVSVDVVDNVPYWSVYLRQLPLFRQIHSVHNFFGFDLERKYWLLGTLTQLICVGPALFYLSRLSGII